MRIVGHEEAAKGQLEQALFLWFHKDDQHIVLDASSIHTLAFAVQGILWAYAHDSQQRPSKVTQTIEKLPPDQRDLTDFFLADNVWTFNRLFMRSSRLMDTFLRRYSFSFPKSGISLKTLEMKLVSSGHDLKAVAGLNRKGFYELVSTYAVANLREQRAAHSASPAERESP